MAITKREVQAALDRAEQRRDKHIEAKNWHMVRHCTGMIEAYKIVLSM